MIQSLLNSDCGCGGSVTQGTATYSTETLDHNYCSGITVDLLRMYQRPIQCCLNNKLWNVIGYAIETLQQYNNLLETIIAAKIADPNSCEGLDQLEPIQELSNIFIKKRLCI